MTVYNVVLSDTIAEHTDVVGLNNYKLRGGIHGFFRFSDVYTDGDTVLYHVADGPNIEIVVGVYDATANTLSRDTILTSSNSGSKINWSGNTRPLLHKAEFSGIFIISFSEPAGFGDRTVDEWDDNYEMFDVVMPFSVGFPADFSTSPIPGCEVAPAADVTMTFQKITSGVPIVVGTFTILAGATTGAFATTGGDGFTVDVNERLRLYADGDVDSSIVGVYGTVWGNR